MEWINFKDTPPTKETNYCWVMNCRRGCYGFLAYWDSSGKYFGLCERRSEDRPALDVTHYYPLPEPYYKDD